eukprot:scaffold98053_cov34-Attheya_sp.AAC.1
MEARGSSKMSNTRLGMSCPNTNRTVVMAAVAVVVVVVPVDPLPPRWMMWWFHAVWRRFRRMDHRK